ncbi:tRNA pseudouridine(38-40) synthase TruA [Acidaminobacter sp. JC074]|uniref:tRNA pseudouridine(38-40) synthase TruA n=1 Tax=Acidaminobacter sp. JC074 TaxID=2530199 RepID=UPI001F0DC2E4|nr:tRNA pseudouridine(38-40) synthase TruA [Acidaminobacter sp. JC074]
MDIIKMIIEYDGTHFYGWQRQTKSRSIQGVIERVLSKILKKDIEIDGAGRTDAGVHAYGQVATFGCDLPMPLESLKRAMNNFLPSDVRIVDLDFADADFHARYSAIGKTYVYKIKNSKERDVFLANYSYHYPYDLDDDLIRRAMEKLIGKHDFSSFMASGSSAQNPVRTIHAIDLKRSGNMLEFTFTGDGFLYKMVRLLAAYLLEVGQSRIPLDKTEELLENPTRAYTSKVAPAAGLYLKEVYYN